MKKLFLMLFLAFPSYAGEEHPVTFATTVGELRVILENMPDQDQPLAIAVGGYKAAPVKIVERFMTPDLRRYWWDKHVDDSAVIVVVLTETSTEEIPRKQ